MEELYTLTSLRSGAHLQAISDNERGMQKAEDEVDQRDDDLWTLSEAQGEAASHVPDAALYMRPMSLSSQLIASQLPVSHTSAGVVKPLPKTALSNYNAFTMASESLTAPTISSDAASIPFLGASKSSPSSPRDGNAKSSETSFKHGQVEESPKSKASALSRTMQSNMTARPDLARKLRSETMRSALRPFLNRENFAKDQFEIANTRVQLLNQKQPEVPSSLYPNGDSNQVVEELDKLLMTSTETIAKIRQQNENNSSLGIPVSLATRLRVQQKRETALRRIISNSTSGSDVSNNVVLQATSDAIATATKPIQSIKPLPSNVNAPATSNGLGLLRGVEGEWSSMTPHLARVDNEGPLLEPRLFPVERKSNPKSGNDKMTSSPQKKGIKSIESEEINESNGTIDKTANTAGEGRSTYLNGTDGSDENNVSNAATFASKRIESAKLLSRNYTRSNRELDALRSAFEVRALLIESETENQYKQMKENYEEDLKEYERKLVHFEHDLRKYETQWNYYRQYYIPLIQQHQQNQSNQTGQQIGLPPGVPSPPIPPQEPSPPPALRLDRVVIATRAAAKISEILLSDSELPAYLPEAWIRNSNVRGQIDLLRNIYKKHAKEYENEMMQRSIRTQRMKEYHKRMQLLAAKVEEIAKESLQPQTPPSQPGVNAQRPIWHGTSAKSALHATIQGSGSSEQKRVIDLLIERKPRLPQEATGQLPSRQSAYQRTKALFESLEAKKLEKHEVNSSQESLLSNQTSDKAAMAAPPASAQSEVQASIRKVDANNTRTKESDAEPAKTGSTWFAERDSRASLQQALALFRVNLDPSELSKNALKPRKPAKANLKKSSSKLAKKVPLKTTKRVPKDESIQNIGNRSADSQNEVKPRDVSDSKSGLETKPIKQRQIGKSRKLTLKPKNKSAERSRAKSRSKGSATYENKVDFGRPTRPSSRVSTQSSSSSKTATGQLTPFSKTSRRSFSNASSRSLSRTESSANVERATSQTDSILDPSEFKTDEARKMAEHLASMQRETEEAFAAIEREHGSIDESEIETQLSDTASTGLLENDDTENGSLAQLVGETIDEFFERIARQTRRRSRKYKNLKKSSQHEVEQISDKKIESMQRRFSYAAHREAAAKYTSDISDLTLGINQQDIEKRYDIDKRKGDQGKTVGTFERNEPHSPSSTNSSKSFSGLSMKKMELSRKNSIDKLKAKFSRRGRLKALSNQHRTSTKKTSKKRKLFGYQMPKKPSKLVNAKDEIFSAPERSKPQKLKPASRRKAEEADSASQVYSREELDNLLRTADDKIQALNLERETRFEAYRKRITETSSNMMNEAIHEINRLQLWNSHADRQAKLLEEVRKCQNASSNHPLRVLALRGRTKEDDAVLTQTIDTAAQIAKNLLSFSQPLPTFISHTELNLRAPGIKEIKNSIMPLEIFMSTEIGEKDSNSVSKIEPIPVSVVIGPGKPDEEEKAIERAEIESSAQARIIAQQEAQDAQDVASAAAEVAASMNYTPSNMLSRSTSVPPPEGHFHFNSSFVSPTMTAVISPRAEFPSSLSPQQKWNTSPFGDPQSNLLSPMNQLPGISRQISSLSLSTSRVPAAQIVSNVTPVQPWRDISPVLSSHSSVSLPKGTEKSLTNDPIVSATPKLSTGKDDNSSTLDTYGHVGSIPLPYHERMMYANTVGKLPHQLDAALFSNLLNNPQRWLRWEIEDAIAAKSGQNDHKFALGLSAIRKFAQIHARALYASIEESSSQDDVSATVKRENNESVLDTENKKQVLMDYEALLFSLTGLKSTPFKNLAFSPKLESKRLERPNTLLSIKFKQTHKLPSLKNILQAINSSQAALNKDSSKTVDSTENVLKGAESALERLNDVRLGSKLGKRPILGFWGEDSKKLRELRKYFKPGENGITKDSILSQLAFDNDPRAFLLTHEDVGARTSIAPREDIILAQSRIKNALVQDEIMLAMDPEAKQESVHRPRQYFQDPNLGILISASDQTQSITVPKPIPGAVQFDGLAPSRGAAAFARLISDKLTHKDSKTEYGKSGGSIVRLSTFTKDTHNEQKANKGRNANNWNAPLEDTIPVVQTQLLVIDPQTSISVSGHPPPVSNEEQTASTVFVGPTTPTREPALLALPPPHGSEDPRPTSQDNTPRSVISSFSAQPTPSPGNNHFGHQRGIAREHQSFTVSPASSIQPNPMLRNGVLSSAVPSPNVSADSSILSRPSSVASHHKMMTAASALAVSTEDRTALGLMRRIAPVVTLDMKSIAAEMQQDMSVLYESQREGTPKSGNTSPLSQITQLFGMPSDLYPETITIDELYGSQAQNQVGFSNGSTRRRLSFVPPGEPPTLHELGVLTLSPKLNSKVSPLASKTTIKETSKEASKEPKALNDLQAALIQFASSQEVLDFEPPTPKHLKSRRFDFSPSSASSLANQVAHQKGLSPDSIPTSYDDGDTQSVSALSLRSAGTTRIVSRKLTSGETVYHMTRVGGAEADLEDDFTLSNRSAFKHTFEVVEKNRSDSLSQEDSSPHTPSIVNNEANFPKHISNSSESYTPNSKSSQASKAQLSANVFPQNATGSATKQDITHLRRTESMLSRSSTPFVIATGTIDTFDISPNAVGKTKSKMHLHRQSFNQPKREVIGSQTAVGDNETVGSQVGKPFQDQADQNQDAIVDQDQDNIVKTSDKIYEDYYRPIYSPQTESSLSPVRHTKLDRVSSVILTQTKFGRKASQDTPTVLKKRHFRNMSLRSTESLYSSPASHHDGDINFVSQATSENLSDALGTQTVMNEQTSFEDNTLEDKNMSESSKDQERLPPLLGNTKNSQLLGEKRVLKPQNNNLRIPANAIAVLKVPQIGNRSHVSVCIPLPETEKAGSSSTDASRTPDLQDNRLDAKNRQFIIVNRLPFGESLYTRTVNGVLKNDKESEGEPTEDNTSYGNTLPKNSGELTELEQLASYNAHVSTFMNSHQLPKILHPNSPMKQVSSNIHAPTAARHISLTGVDMISNADTDDQSMHLTNTQHEDANTFLGVDSDVENETRQVSSFGFHDKLSKKLYLKQVAGTNHTVDYATHSDDENEHEIEHEHEHERTREEIAKRIVSQQNSPYARGYHNKQSSSKRGSKFFFRSVAATPIIGEDDASSISTFSVSAEQSRVNTPSIGEHVSPMAHLLKEPLAYNMPVRSTFKSIDKKHIMLQEGLGLATPDNHRDMPSPQANLKGVANSIEKTNSPSGENIMHMPQRPNTGVDHINQFPSPKVHNNTLTRASSTSIRPPLPPQYPKAPTLVSQLNNFTSQSPRSPNNTTNQQMKIVGKTKSKSSKLAQIAASRVLQKLKGVTGSDESTAMDEVNGTGPSRKPVELTQLQTQEHDDEDEINDTVDSTRHSISVSSGNDGISSPIIKGRIRTPVLSTRIDIRIANLLAEGDIIGADLLQQQASCDIGLSPRYMGLMSPNTSSGAFFKLNSKDSSSTPSNSAISSVSSVPTTSSAKHDVQDMKDREMKTKEQCHELLMSSASYTIHKSAAYFKTPSGTEVIRMPFKPFLHSLETTKKQTNHPQQSMLQKMSKRDAPQAELGDSEWIVLGSGGYSNTCKDDTAQVADMAPQRASYRAHLAKTVLNGKLQDVSNQNGNAPSQIDVELQLDPLTTETISASLQNSQQQKHPNLRDKSQLDLIPEQSLLSCQIGVSLDRVLSANEGKIRSSSLLIDSKGAQAVINRITVAPASQDDKHKEHSNEFSLPKISRRDSDIKKNDLNTMLEVLSKTSRTAVFEEFPKITQNGMEEIVNRSAASMKLNLTRDEKRVVRTMVEGAHLKEVPLTSSADRHSAKKHNLSLLKASDPVKAPGIAWLETIREPLSVERKSGPLKVGLKYTRPAVVPNTSARKRL